MTRIPIEYNPKHYQKEFQAVALKWWSHTLSINEQKRFEQKYKIIYDMAIPSEITAIYYSENP